MQDNYYVRDLIQRIEGKSANGAYRSVTPLLIFWHQSVYRVGPSQGYAGFTADREGGHTADSQ